METETRTVSSMIDHDAEDPALGFAEALYQACTATLVHLWKLRRQFIPEMDSAQVSILKKDVADLRLREESFPPGHLDTILAQSHHFGISVIESLVKIGKILKLRCSLTNASITPDRRESRASTWHKRNSGWETIAKEVVDKAWMPSPMRPRGMTVGAQYERNVMKELLLQLECLLGRAADILVAKDDFGTSSSDDESSTDSDPELESEDENERSHLGRLHCYVQCMIDHVPVLEKQACRMHSEREPLLISPDDFSTLPERARPQAVRIRDRLVVSSICLLASKADN